MPRYRVIVDPDLCKGCGICIDKCPFKVFEMSDRVGSYGEPLPNPVREDRCTGCGVCVLLCPDFAIRVIRGEG